MLPGLQPLLIRRLCSSSSSHKTLEASGIDTWCRSSTGECRDARLACRWRIRPARRLLRVSQGRAVNSDYRNRCFVASQERSGSGWWGVGREDERKWSGWGWMLAETANRRGVMVMRWRSLAVLPDKSDARARPGCDKRVVQFGARQSGCRSFPGSCGSYTTIEVVVVDVCTSGSPISSCQPVHDNHGMRPNQPVLLLPRPDTADKYLHRNCTANPSPSSGISSSLSCWQARKTPGCLAASTCVAR